MNIMIASNSKYIPFCKVMLASLFECETDTDMDIYMPYEGLSTEELEELREFICEHSGKRFFPMPVSSEFKEAVVSHNGISIETYYRILAIDMLPDTVEKILYLDCDMVVRKSLREFYDTEFEGNSVFAVCEDIIGVLNGFHEANKKRMNIPQEYSYFNAGVMLMNIAVLKAEGACGKIVDRVYSGYSRYEYNDQDVLNEMYFDRLIYMPWEKYNCPPAIYYSKKKSAGSKGNTGASDYELLTYREIKELSKDPESFSSSVCDVAKEICDNANIIHFMANTKPWSGDREKSHVYDRFDRVYFDARERAGLKPDYSSALKAYLAANYSLIYLEGMLGAAAIPEADTLILGSSYGLTDIDMRVMTTAVNLSLTSQDLCRDYMMLKKALENRGKPFEKLILILGEYALYDNMEKSSMGRRLLDTVYSGLFENADRWKAVENIVTGLCNADKTKIEQMASSLIYEKGSFFNDLYRREDNCEEKYRGLVWADATAEERERFAVMRASDHNRLYKPDSAVAEENKSYLNKILALADSSGMKVFVVFPPFTSDYDEKLDPSMKREILDLLDISPFTVELLDFKALVEDGTFLSGDFFDMDHLSESGAIKLSYILRDY